MLASIRPGDKTHGPAMNDEPHDVPGSTPGKMEKHGYCTLCRSRCGTVNVVENDTLLSVRGIVDFREAEESEAETQARDRDIRAGLAEAIRRLADMRRKEGTALADVLLGQVARIEALTAAVEADPSRSVAAIAERLATQVATLMQGATALDRDRLNKAMAGEDLPPTPDMETVIAV